MADESKVVLSVETDRASGDIARIRKSLDGVDRAADSVTDSIDDLFVSAKRASGSVGNLANAGKSIKTSKLPDLMRKASRSTSDYSRSLVDATAGTRKFSRGLDDASSHAAKYSSAVSKARKSVSDLINRHADVDLIRREWSSLSTTLQRFGIAAAAQTVAGAMQFGTIETALRGVEKTTDLTVDQVDELNRALSEASVGKLPILKTSMLEIAEAAGTVGIKGVGNLKEYISTLSELEKATDLVGRGAVEKLTRIMTVQGEGPENIRRLASVLVFLGNNAAATESQIARMTNEIALSTAQFRIGSTVAAAFATAMVESGIRAELGGSVIGRVMRDIQKSVVEGGAMLDKFAEAAKMSSDQFVAAWRAGPTEALNALLKGLGQSGERMTIILDDLGLKGDEVGKVIPVLAKNFDLLATRQRMAAEESVRMTALTNEASRAFDTQEADLTRLLNSVLLLGESFGRALSPALRETAMALIEVSASQGVIEFFQDIGSYAGSVIKILPILADHIDLIKVAVVALIATKAAIWFQSTAAGAWALQAAMLPLNKATLAFVAIDIKAALATMSASFTTASFAAGGLVGAIGLGGLAGALLILNKHIKDTAEAIAASTQRMVDSANSTRESWERTSESIEKGTLALLTKDLNDTSIALIKAEQKQSLLNRRLEAAESRLKEYSKSSRASVEGITRLTKAVTNLTEGLEDQSGVVESFRAQQARLTAKIKESEREFHKLLDAVKPPKFEGWDVGSEKISEMTGEAKKLRDELLGSIEALSNAGMKARETGLSVEILAAHFKDLKKVGIVDESQSNELLKLRKRLEELRDRLKEIDEIGSLKKSMSRDAELLSKAAVAADRYGVELDKMVEYYRKLSQFKYISEDDERALIEQAIALDKYNEQLRTNLELRQRISQAGIDLAVGEVTGRTPAAGIADSIIDSEQFQSSMDQAFDGVVTSWLEASGDIEQIWVETADGLVQEWRVVEDAVSSTADRLSDSLMDVANLISQMDGDIGQIAGSFARIGSSAVDYFAARRSGDSAAIGQSREQLMSNIGNVVGSILGHYLSFGGTSKYGGRKEGTYASEGAQIGAAFGGFGAVVGAIFGAFVKKGADDLEIALTDAGAQIIKAEGGLADLATQMADVLNQFIAEFEQSIGQDISVAAADLSFKIRGEMLTVMVNGVEQAFDSVDDAIAWGLEQVLATIDEADLGENLGALIGGFQPGGGTPTGDIQELSQAIALALDLDRYVGGMGAFGDEMSALFRKMDENVELAIRYHLSLEDLRKMHQSMIDTLMARLEAEGWAMFGVSSNIDRIRELAQAMQDFDAAVQARPEDQARRVEELQQQIAALEQSIASASQSTQNAATEITASGDQIGRDVQDVMGGISEIPPAADEAARALVDDQNELRSLQAELDLLLETLGEIPEIFGEQAIVDLWENEAASIMKGFIGLIRMWRDEEYGAQELRLAETKQYGLTLAAQIAMAQTVLETVTVLSDVTRSMLQGMVDDALQILDEIAGGALLPPSGRAGAGGRREERRRIRDDFNEQMRGLRLAYDGLSDAAIAVRDSVGALRDFAQEAIDAGISVERAARFIEMSIQMMEDAFTEPFRERVMAAGESPLQTELRGLTTQYEDFLQEAYEIAVARSQEIGTPLEEALANLTQDMGPAFGLDLRDAFLAALDDAVTEEDLAEVMEIWNQLLSTEMPDVMRQGLAGVIGEIEAAFADANQNIIDEEEEARRDRQRELDQRLKQYRRDSGGLSEFEMELENLQVIFEELEAETREAGFTSEEYARRVAELALLYADASRRLAETSLSGFISELSQYGALTPELERIQRQLTIATLQRSKADALAAISAAWAAGELQNLGLTLAELMNEIATGYDDAIRTVSQIPDAATVIGRIPPGAPPGIRPGVPGDPTQPISDPGRNFAEELDRLLSPLEELAFGPIKREYMRLTDQFQTIRDLLDEMAASEEERLRAADAMSIAMDHFWDKVGSRLDEFLGRLEQEDARISAREREVMAKTEFQDLLRQVMAGDVDALDDLMDAADEWRGAASDYLGPGGRYYEVFDQIKQSLQAVRDSLGDVPLLQSGGFTTGEGIARLHSNELILSPTQTRDLFDFMDSMQPSIGSDIYGPITRVSDSGELMQLQNSNLPQGNGNVSDIKAVEMHMREAVRILSKILNSQDANHDEQIEVEEAQADGLSGIATGINELTIATSAFASSISRPGAPSGGIFRR